MDYFLDEDWDDKDANDGHEADGEQESSGQEIDSAEEGAEYGEITEVVDPDGTVRYYDAQGYEFYYGEDGEPYYFDEETEPEDESLDSEASNNTDESEQKQNGKKQDITEQTMPEESQAGSVFGNIRFSVMGEPAEVKPVKPQEPVKNEPPVTAKHSGKNGFTDYYDTEILSEEKNINNTGYQSGNNAEIVSEDLNIAGGEDFAPEEYYSDEEFEKLLNDFQDDDDGVAGAQAEMPANNYGIIRETVGNADFNGLTKEECADVLRRRDIANIKAVAEATEQRRRDNAALRELIQSENAEQRAERLANEKLLREEFTRETAQRRKEVVENFATRKSELNQKKEESEKKNDPVKKIKFSKKKIKVAEPSESVVDTFEELQIFGPGTIRILNNAGFFTPSQLIKAGTRGVYLKLKQTEKSVPLALLFSVEAGIRQTHPSKLNPLIKDDIRKLYVKFKDEKTSGQTFLTNAAFREEHEMRLKADADRRERQGDGDFFEEDYTEESSGEYQEAYAGEYGEEPQEEYFEEYAEEETGNN